MNQNNDTNLKCPNSEHVNNVKLVCVNESCKADRLQCIQCIQNGIHVSHLQNQQDLPFLFYNNSNIEKQCEDLIIDLNKINGYGLLIILIFDWRKNLNINSLNQILNKRILSLQKVLESNHFNKLTKQIKQSIKEFQDLIVKQLSNLKLSELNLYQISNLDFNKSEELHKKGQEINIYGPNSIIYQDDKNFQDTIKIFDESLIFNPKHSLSLWCKASSLRMLSQYNEAIVCADKALQFIRLLKMFKQSMVLIEQSLQINPNHFDSLRAKGICLQDQNQYQEALIFYEKALKINPNNQWTRDRKGIIYTKYLDECLKAINQK
ncbi:unnamed protein product [Paramecium primaurelia]|uniref:Tetratricopeptide repeat protein n=1 Tax=Paramecium primaurelia TaxID=5886 RepID=A0A8S1K059_PARPR|nr:unnamed protein product [Paramecium primaurelia]